MGDTVVADRHRKTTCPCREEKGVKTRVTECNRPVPTNLNPGQDTREQTTLLVGLTNACAIPGLVTQPTTYGTLLLSLAFEFRPIPSHTWNSHFDPLIHARFANCDRCELIRSFKSRRGVWLFLHVVVNSNTPVCANRSWTIGQYCRRLLDTHRWWR